MMQALGLRCAVLGDGGENVGALCNFDGTDDASIMALVGEDIFGVTAITEFSLL